MEERKEEKKIKIELKETKTMKKKVEKSARQFYLAENKEKGKAEEKRRRK